MGGSHSKRILKNLDLVDLKQIVQNDVFQKLDFTKAQVGDNDLFLDLDYIDMKRAHDTHTLINLDVGNEITNNILKVWAIPTRIGHNDTLENILKYTAYGISSKKVVLMKNHNLYLSKIYNRKVYIIYCYVNRICYNIFRSV